MSSSTLQRSVDILFVIDNSGSMGTEQGLLAANFPAFLRVLEQQRFGANYRVGITTTDGSGNLRMSSCRERLNEFVFYDPFDDLTVDATYDGCLASCPYESVATLPTYNDGSAVAQPRPWLEKNGGLTNLADGLGAEQALACAGPQGIAGSGFEMPLESMYAVLRGQGNSAGFVRDEALLAVVFVTDETDCSTSPEKLELLASDASRALWSDSSEDARLTSAVCWNAGTRCTGGPGVYDECHAADVDFDAQLTAPGDAALYPLDRYITALRDAARAKAERGGTSQVLVAVIGGVPEGYPADGVWLFADSEDPAFNIEYGIGPGCGRGTETINNPPGIPPVRAAEFAEAFASEGRNLYSICSPDYTPALEQIVASLARLDARTCVPGCVADMREDLTGLQPRCEIVETRPGEIEFSVPRCAIWDEGWAFPSTSPEVCYRPLDDVARTTLSTFDDMSRQCVTQGSNLELVVERPDDVVIPDGTQVQVTCELSRPVDQTCSAVEHD